MVRPGPGDRPSTRLVARCPRDEPLDRRWALRGLSGLRRAHVLLPDRQPLGSSVAWPPPLRATPPVPDAPALLAMATRLIERAGTQTWEGPDPFDGLCWNWPRPPVATPRRRRLVIFHAHARAPVDLRRLYRSRDPRLAKGLALFALAGLRVAAQTGEERIRTLSVDALELLCADRRAGALAWGYPFDTEHRWASVPANTPSLVPTRSPSPRSSRGVKCATWRREFGDRARAAGQWVLDELWQPERGHFAYHVNSPLNIHNANLLRAALGFATHQDAPPAGAAGGSKRPLAAQARDGSWPYGDASGNLGWPDSFDTVYAIPRCLDQLETVSPAIPEAIARGADYYRRFIGPVGEARLWPHRPYPEDGHSGGTALTALAMLRRRGLIERDFLERVAGRFLAVGIRDGHVVHRRYRGGLRSTVRYLRWCDAHGALGPRRRRRRAGARLRPRMMDQSRG